jgi:putative transcriptional regulator
MLLVAAGHLVDPFFSRTVVLLLSHNEQGSSGLIINRPSHKRLIELVPGLPGLNGSDDRLFFGGPVALGQRLMILRSDSAPAGASNLVDDLYVSRSRRLLEQLLSEPGGDFRIFSGYAGWGRLQLDAEIQRGDWLLMPVQPALIFGLDPKQVWPLLMGYPEGQMAVR